MLSIVGDMNIDGDAPVINLLVLKFASILKMLI